MAVVTKNCNLNKNQFNNALLKAIDESFSWIGETEKRTIYFYLAAKYNINKNDIPNRIEDFTKAIEDIFGMGAKILEIKIMKNLFTKIGYSLQYLDTEEGLEFTKYIQAARANR
jgi:hypothetical protein